MPRSKISRSSPEHKWLEDNPIRIWRKRNKQSLQTLAIALNTSKQLVHSWERGHCYPNATNLEGLTKITNITLIHLITWREAIPSKV